MNLRGRIRHCYLYIFLSAVAAHAAPVYAPVRPVERSFGIPDVRSANVSLVLRSVDNAPLYKLQCHSADYTGDTDFEYSGDFECRLSSIGGGDEYSTLLTEDARQTRDWESRGRFFAAELKFPCSHIPNFGSTRSFALRGMRLTLEVTDPKFTVEGKLKSIGLTVTVRPDPLAQRPIAEIVPIPNTAIAHECGLRRLFVNYYKVDNE